MRRRRKLSKMDKQNQIEKYKGNNIAFAKELTCKRQEIQDLRIELHEKSWDLQKMIQRLNSESEKNVMLQDQLRKKEKEIERFQTALCDRDETINNYRTLLISLFKFQTEKYCEVMRAIGALPTRNDTVGKQSEPVNQAEKSVSLTDMVFMSNPVTPEKSVTTLSPQNAICPDNALKSEETASQPCSLYPGIEIVNHGDGPEFSDDSAIESPLPSKATSHSIQIKTELGLEGTSTDEQSKKIVNSSPKIVITKCQDNENLKRESIDGFLKIPKFSAGKRRSEPKTAFETKSPTLPHRANSVSLPTSVRVRSTSLSKISETSPLKERFTPTTKSAGMINHLKVSPLNVRSPKSPLNNLINNPNNARPSKSPIIQMRSNSSSAGTNDTISSSRTSKNPLNSPNNKRIHPVSAIPKWCHPNTPPMNRTNGIVLTEKNPKKPLLNVISTIYKRNQSPLNRANGIVVTGQTPKSPLLNIVNKKNQSNSTVINSRSLKNSSNKIIKIENEVDGSIAKSRPKRNAAPTDLREPLLKTKMRRNL